MIYSIPVIAGLALLLSTAATFAQQKEAGESNRPAAATQTEKPLEPTKTDLERLAGPPAPAPVQDPPLATQGKEEPPPATTTPDAQQAPKVLPKTTVEKPVEVRPPPVADLPLTPRPVPNPPATTETATPPAAPPAARIPATDKVAPSATAAAPAPTGACKPTLIKREDTDKHPNFGVTFPRGDFEGIKRCNPGAEVQDTRLGPMLTVTYQRGHGAPIQLPDTMATGDANNAKCVGDENANAVDVVLRKQQWTGGIPAVIELTKVDRAFYDAEKLLAKCRQFAAERRFR